VLEDAFTALLSFMTLCIAGFAVYAVVKLYQGQR
jgi:hypothetical protein